MNLGKFQKAKREQLWAKIMLAGPSGSGKSYSALRMAKGLAEKCGSRVAAIDTENGRIRYYADELDFDDIQLEAPFTPEKYIEAINDAVDSGYKVLVIDSISHEWDYCLKVHNKMPGNSWTNWAKVTPRHDAFMEKILQAPIHVIVTTRGKDEYVLEEKNGKQVPKKVGLGYKQRDGIEYNYTATFNLAQDTHVAEVTKDNTHLFEGRYDVLTEKDGVAIYEWANTGEPAAPKPKKPSGQVVDELPDIIAKIDVKAQELAAAGVTKDVIANTVSGVSDGLVNYRKVKEVDTAKAILAALDKVKPAENA